MRILALDVGDATIGMAVSDELGIAAHGLPTLRRTRLDADLAELGRVIAEKSVGRLVVGIPYNMDGTQSEQTKKVIAFKEKLSVLGLPIDETDERWTTVAAERAMLEGDLSRKKRKKLVDKVAAVLILQTYLGGRKPGS
jgi:putative holliday junction resolvase